jgi:hypothetical protein
MMAESRAQIEDKISGINQKPMGIGGMRTGSLTHQYHKPDEKRGGFHRISWSHKMRSKTEYKDFKRLVQQWADLALEHSRLKMAEAKRTGNLKS